jgi:hypothetical protein
VRSQRRANLHANRASHQLGQHNLFGGRGRCGPGNRNL